MDSLTLADFTRDIVGADRGFHVGSDVITQTVDGVPYDKIWEELQAALAIWNKSRDAMTALFTVPVTDSIEYLPLDGGKVDLEKASEFGVPQAGRVQPGYYGVAFDLDWYDSASRFTRRFLRNARSSQITSIQVAMQEADNRLLFTKIMSMLTTPTGGSWGNRALNPEDQTIYSLYAGASDDKPPTAPDGTTFAGSHTHFLVSGAATVDSGDLDDLMVKVTEHGRGLKSNGEQLVIVVNKQEGEVIRGFRVANSDKYDFIATAAAPAYLTDQTLVGTRPPETFQGLDVIGSYGDALIVQHPLMKAGYMVAVATGEKVVAFREHVVAANRGFRLVSGPAERYPLTESIYERGFGLGIRRREGAAVMQIKASGTYDVPVW